MVNKVFTTQNPTETQHLAEKLAKTIKGGEIFCLYGELGSGKTTFVQGLARGLGMEKQITSPTFILIRQYAIRNTLTFYHLDLYRLENIKDTQSLGLDEILNQSDNIVCIEWAEKIKEILPKNRIDIHFKNLGDNKRKIIINIT